MSFSPKNEVLAFRAPLARSEERCGVDCESTRQVWQKWRARTLRPMLGCSDIGTLGAALGRFETTIFLPEFEYISQCHLESFLSPTVVTVEKGYVLAYKFNDFSRVQNNFFKLIFYSLSFYNSLKFMQETSGLLFIVS